MKINLSDLASKYDIFILDVDGTLWESNQEIGNSKKALEFLNSQGKTVFYLTNDSYERRSKFAKRFAKIMGFEPKHGQIYNSARITANFVKENGYKSAYIIGGEGIIEELLQINPNFYSKGMQDSGKIYDQNKFWINEFDYENIPDCVIIGIDPGFNFYKLTYSINCIGFGAKFIATNTDHKVKNGKFFMPGAGPIVSAVQKASNKSPIIMGKPSEFPIKLMAKNMGENFELSKCIIIGDSLATDIKFAKQNNIASCCVLTGVTKLEDIENMPKNEKPDFYMGQLGDL